MKLQHIQLEDCNIIVSDEDIKKGENTWYYDNFTNKIYNSRGAEYENTEQCKKAIASTNPIHNLPSIDYTTLITKEGVTKTAGEWLGIINIEKLAEEFGGNGKYLTDKKFGFREGFKKCQELNDKKFSLKDINTSIAFGFGVCRKENRAPFNLEIKEFIQSLQQPKVNNIEVEMEILPQAYGNGKYSQPKITNNQFKITEII